MAKETRTERNEPREEGPRSFGVILQKVADGSAESELSRELFALTKTIKDEARMRPGKIKGTLTLKLNVEAEGDDGVVKVSYFWFTEGGNLTAQAPKQSKLPFQDVANERGIPNDLPLDGDDAREA